MASVKASLSSGLQDGKRPPVARGTGSFRDDIRAYVTLERAQIDVPTARQAQKVLDERTVVGQQRPGADEGAELVGAGLERGEQLIEGLDVEVVQSPGAARHFQLPIEVAPAKPLRFNRSSEQAAVDPRGRSG